MFKIQRCSEEASFEGLWVREEEVSPTWMKTYYSRLNMEARRTATDKKLSKAKKAGIQRSLSRRGMEQFAPLWNALTPAERAATLELYAADADLRAVSCGIHKEENKEKLVNAQTAGILCA
eukprot:10424418-Karenia_brevis.AAC.1